MSKSLGNSPNPLDLIEIYGADGIRVGMLLSSPAGNDLMFDEALCQQGKQFANKIWNAFRLIEGWEVSETITQPEAAKSAIDWYDAKFQETLVEIEDHFSKYRLSDALMSVYKLIWDDFASWLLEIVKPAYEQPIDAKTFKEVMEALENNLKILHPFMPFLTEEIWQHIEKRTPEEALIIAEYPTIKSVDTQLIADFDYVTNIISGIRTIRKEKNISFKEKIDVSILNNEKFTKDLDAIVIKLGNIENLNYISEKIDGALTFRVKANEYFIPISGVIDLEVETKKLTEELNYTEGFLRSVQKKLSNERFVSNAPEQVIASERNKEADALAKIETLKASLASLQ
jgi:valyl-tRNA synthetase